MPVSRKPRSSKTRLLRLARLKRRGLSLKDLRDIQRISRSLFPILLPQRRSSYRRS